MASAWGDWTSRSSSQQRFRLGIDYTVSGTRITITRYKVQAQFSINQGVTLVRSGSMSGSVDFNFSTGGGVVNISGSGGTINGSRGSTYTIGGRVTGIYNGLVPTLSHQITIPAAAPNTPAAPTISNIGARSARLNWSPPNNNGASITRYGYRVERGGNFIDGGYTSNTYGNVSGLDPNTRYGARVRAQNSAGWSSFSSFRYFTTDAVAPNRPATPSVSNITSRGVTVSWSAPNNNGASITDYQVRVFGPGGGTVLVANTGTSRSRRFSSGLQPNTTYTVAVRAYNAGGWSDYSPSRAFTTDVLAPTAPSNLTASRSSDTRIDLSWTNRSSSARPYDTQQIQRRTNDGGWVTIANVGGSATTYSDTGTSSNSKYEYAIRARNAAGTSSWAYAPVVYTTPATPTNLVAEKDDDGNVILTWTNPARYPTGFRIGHQTNGTGDYDLIEAITGNANTTEWVHLNPDPAVTHRYAIRATRGTLQSSLSSPSNTVQLQAPPDAPTILGPEGPQDATEVITLTWRHVPVDSSRQRQAQVRWRVAGDTSWTTEAIQAGRTAAFEVPADTWDNGTNIEWQVRTWGQDPDSSPWSATGLITLSGKPIAGIIFPPDGGMVLEPTTPVQWSFFDPEGDPQSGWQVELLDAEESVIETRSGSGTTDQIILNTLLEDEQTYTVRVRVRDSVGQWSEWDTSTFGVQYPRPVPPTIDLEWMEQSGNINVAVTNYDPATDSFSRVNEVHNPRGVKTSGQVTARQNRIANPSFENGVDGVTSGTHAIIDTSQNREGVYAGQQAMEVTVLADATEETAAVSQSIDLTSGYSWEVGASMYARRVSGTTQAARIGITFYDGEDPVGGTAYGPITPLETGSIRGMEPLTFKATAPVSTVSSAVVSLHFLSEDGSAPTTGIIQTDAWLADRGAAGEVVTLPYFDGDSVPAQQSLYAEWDGDEQASTSGLIGNAPDGWTRGSVYLYSLGEGIEVLRGVGAGTLLYMSPTPVPQAAAGDRVRMAVEVTPRVPMTVTLGEEEFTDLPVGEMTRLLTTYVADAAGDAYAVVSFTPDEEQNPLAPLAVVDKMLVEVGPDLPALNTYFDGDTPNRSLPSGHQSIYYWTGDPYESPSQADYVPSEETIYNDIYRSIDGGEWELVATHVPVNGNFLDRTNAVVGENCYYAVAWSSNESAARGETECLTIYNGAVNYCPPGEHSSLSAWVSGGENYTLYCRAFFDLSIDEETGAETRTLHRFAGRTYPVEFSGRGLSQVIDLKFTTRREEEWRGEQISTLDQWRELLRLPGPHLLRTYKGHRFEVSVSPIQANGTEGEIEECTLTLTRTAVDLTRVPDPEQGGDDG